MFNFRYLFFTKWGVRAGLDRTLLDGSNRTTIVSNKIVYPIAITLDLANQEVYWTDAYMNSIERVNYNGEKRWRLKKKPVSSFSILYL